MVFASPINMNSASMVRDELDKCMTHAIETSAQLKPDSSACLSGLVDELRQIDGILRVLECAGAVELSAVVLALAQQLMQSPEACDESTVELLGRGLSALQAYLSYCFKRRQALPLVLHSLLNELRASLSMPALSEVEQVEYQLPASLPAASSELDLTPLLAADVPRLKRLHHMYQVGLLGALTGANASVNLRLMACALARLQQEFGEIADGQWWSLVSELVACFGRGDLRLSAPRKRMLTAVDACLRRRLRHGDGVPMVLEQGYVREALFLLQLAGEGSANVKAILDHYCLPAAGIDDRQLERIERDLLGSGECLLSGQGQVLREQLDQLKELLNSRWESVDQQLLAQLTAHMQRIGMILDEAGFSRLKGLLSDCVMQLSQARMQHGASEQDVLSLIAEALLVVESTLADPDKFSDHALAGEAPGAPLLARRAREEAIGVVLNESKAAIHLAKRSITAYIESDFDADHVANVGTSLRTVQGAFKILDYQRAAGVIGSCILYVDSRGRAQDSTVQLRRSVETLADALISIEYYIDDLAVSDAQNEELLVVAEQSVAELGCAA